LFVSEISNLPGLDNYATFTEYKKACQQFFANPGDHAQTLRTLLTGNFEIIGL